MADNLLLNAGSGGSTLATASLSFSGDTANVQIVGCGILSGSEGSWTLSQFVGGAGAVAAGVQRVTLASDDPAVVDLAAIETLITAGNVDLAALEVLVTAGNVDLAAIEALLITIDADTSKIPALGQAAMAASAPVVVASDQTAVPVSGTFWQTTQPVSLASVPSHAVTNAGTFVVQVDGAGLTALQLLDDAIHAEAGALSKGMLIALDDGTDAQFAQANASGHLKVDISTDSVGIGGGTQYAVDAALGATPTGTLALAIRDDALAGLTPVEDDAIGLRVDANGALWVIPSGTVAVSGTFWQATQPVSGTFWQATQPVSAASLPLPTGAATEATLSTLDGKVTACDTGAVVLSSGTVTTVSTVSSVTAIANAFPAGTNTIGGTISQQSSSILYDGTTACTIKRASGVAVGGAPGTDSIISAVVGKKFRILALFLKATSATANNVYLSTATDTDVLGNSGNPIPLAVDADGDNDSGFVLPYNQGGWTETSTANEALILNTSAAQDIIWAITYIEVA